MTDGELRSVAVSVRLGGQVPHSFRNGTKLGLFSFPEVVGRKSVNREDPHVDPRLDESDYHLISFGAGSLPMLGPGFYFPATLFCPLLCSSPWSAKSR